MLCLKLEPYAEEIIGIRRGRLNVDQIHIMRQIQEKRQNIDIYQLLIDFQTACDTVWSAKIGSKIHALGVPNKLFNLDRNLISDIYAKVNIFKYLAPKFKVNKRVRRGDAIEALLFNVGIDTASIRYTVKTREPYLKNVVK